MRRLSPVAAFPCLRDTSGPPPDASDLRESGAIEQDADVVMFCTVMIITTRIRIRRISREVIIAKQRNGPIGTVQLDVETGADEVCEFGEIGVRWGRTGEKEWKMLELIQKSMCGGFRYSSPFYRALAGTESSAVDGCLSGEPELQSDSS